MIKTIIFDFGDVFIDLDKPATEKRLYELGMQTIDAEMIHIAQQYEMGKMSSEAFVAYFAKEYNLKSSDLIEAWNAIILEFPEHRLTFLEALAERNDFQLILLSNTNALHIEKVIQNMQEERFERFKACFSKFYLSHEIGYRKPNADIYEFVLRENQLNAQECLFIDDTKENTDAAAALGIHVWNLQPGQDDVIHLFDVNKTLF